jgi:hypothetical protein
MAEKIKGNPEQSYRRARRRKALESISANETNKYTNRLKEKGYSDDDISKGVSAAGALGSAAAIAAEFKGSTDPYLSRNEFKEGFYEQPSKPPTTAETMYGKGTKRGFESPTVDPDTSMMQNMAEGGSVRGQKNIQVKKKQFKGVF